ncbi:MAG: hypothetical protein JO063_08960 [Pseudonocardiales bacterium]|nr:hypothetical protein [Pseudonocardiales bacterium]MBW0010229.1 hypothetical protein [Pseudonocardiales bacterium]
MTRPGICQRSPRCAHPDRLTLPRPIPGVLAVADDEERGKVQRPQPSQDERPCTTTSALHTHPTPEGDTPTASWT